VGFVNLAGEVLVALETLAIFLPDTKEEFSVRYWRVCCAIAISIQGIFL